MKHTRIVGFVLSLFGTVLLLAGCTQGEPGWAVAQLVDENDISYGVQNIDNKPRVSSTPFTYDIAEGNLVNHTYLNKFGHNPTVAGTLETVWTGSNLYPWMTVADQLEVLSSDDEDGGSGGDTGALVLELFGLDADYLLISENITLNGTTVVTSTKSFIRVYRGTVHSAGSAGWNIGELTIRDQDTDVARAIVVAQKNQTLMGIMTIPANSTGFITSWYVGSFLGKNTQVELYIRPYGEVFQVKRNIHLNNAAYTQIFDFPERVTEKSDIEIRAIASGGGGDVSAGFFMWYELNGP